MTIQEQNAAFEAEETVRIRRLVGLNNSILATFKLPIDEASRAIRTNARFIRALDDVEALEAALAFSDDARLWWADVCDPINGAFQKCRFVLRCGRCDKPSCRRIRELDCSRPH